MRKWSIFQQKILWSLRYSKSLKEENQIHSNKKIAKSIMKMKCSQLLQMSKTWKWWSSMFSTCSTNHQEWDSLSSFFTRPEPHKMIKVGNLCLCNLEWWKPSRNSKVKKYFLDWPPKIKYFFSSKSNVSLRSLLMSLFL